MPVTVSGVEGRVMWGYRFAGTLHTWTITKNEGEGWSLSGTLSAVDDFVVSQRPLKFVAPNGWRWPIVDALQTVGASVSARLGPKERIHAAVSDRST